MDWFQIITIIVSIILGIIAIFLPLFIYISNKIDNLGMEILKDLKDFHGRLCAIEERRNK